MEKNYSKNFKDLHKVIRLMRLKLGTALENLFEVP